MAVTFNKPTGRLRDDPRVVAFAKRFGRKVAPLFKRNGWKWGTAMREGFVKGSIPSAEDIADTVLTSMDFLDAQPRTTGSISTGRIRVDRCTTEGSWHVSLEAYHDFILLPKYASPVAPILQLAKPKDT